jgi:hypothetical protein
MNLGDRGDHDRLMASLSFATADRVWDLVNTKSHGGIGYKYDLSDTATNNSVMLELKASDFTGTGTKSGAITVIVNYTIDT